MERRFFKITNHKENHRGFQYQDGLNVLIEPFNDDDSASCVAGGLYFTTVDYIPKYYEYGVNLREVFLPVDHPDFMMVADADGDKYRANMIILGKKYSLFDPETYVKFGLNIEKNRYLVDYASKYGNTDLLDWWIKSGSSIPYTSNAIDLASANGHINVLQWWKDSGLEMKYCRYAIDLASANGHTNVLDWWRISGLSMLYSADSIHYASRAGRINVLDWWKSSGLVLEYSAYAMYIAKHYGQMHVVDWWKSSGLEVIE